MVAIFVPFESFITNVKSFASLWHHIINKYVTKVFKNFVANAKYIRLIKRLYVVNPSFLSFSPAY